jgi:hypothetical protein
MIQMSLSVLGLVVLLLGGLVAACQQSIDLSTPGCHASANAGGGGGGAAGGPEQGGAGAPGGEASAESGCTPGTAKVGDPE